MDLGTVYAMPPQPPVEENTRWFDAGAVTLGVEYRALNPEQLIDTYKDNPKYLAELLDKSPEGGFTDEGVSLHVKSTDDGHEYVRFDVFDGDPHYHYVHKTPPDAEPKNNVIIYDQDAHGDMFEWAMTCLRTRLPAMLTHAGGADVAAKLDGAKVNATVDEVEKLARQALAGGRSEPLPA